MTLFELMNIPTLSGLKVIAGNLGIHRDISSVTIVDTPDGFQWLKGNELVITTGYGLKDTKDSLTKFIENLSHKNASALVIKINRYITDIPESALAMANKLNFTLLTCPEEYAFSEIINPVLTNIINKQSIYLNITAKIHNEFLQLAINNSSIPKILSVLSSFIEKDTVFIDTYFNKCYFSDSHSVVAKDLSHIENYKDMKSYDLKKYNLYPVANKHEQFGHILTLRNDSFSKNEDMFKGNISQTAYEYASIVLILRMQMRISNYMVDEKYRNSFLEDLLLNNIKTESEIHSRSMLYDWDFTDGGQVILFDINKIKKYYIQGLDSKTDENLKRYTQIIFSSAIKSMKKLYPRSKHYILSDLIAFVLSVKDDEKVNISKNIEDVFQSIRTEIAHTTPFTITIGIGEYYNNIIDIHKSYKEAKTAIEIGYLLEKFDCILYYKKMEIYHLLKIVSESRESDFYCNKYIIPIVNYDKIHHSNLLITLQEIINCGWNLKLASEKLYIHYNSSKYRFQKICNILNVDLREHDIQLMVEIALKLYFINNIRLK